MAWDPISGRELNKQRSMCHRRVPHGRECGGSSHTHGHLNALGLVARQAPARAAMGPSESADENNPANLLCIQDKRTESNSPHYFRHLFKTERTSGNGKARAYENCWGSNFNTTASNDENQWGTNTSSTNDNNSNLRTHNALPNRIRGTIDTGFMASRPDRLYVFAKDEDTNSLAFIENDEVLPGQIAGFNNAFVRKATWSDFGRGQVLTRRP